VDDLREIKMTDIPEAIRAALTAALNPTNTEADNG
jgi:hypothetical protein